MSNNLRRALSSGYPALMSGAIIGAIGTIGVLVNQPWLFPSLGPTIVIQSVTPHAFAARSWNIVAGHAIGVGAGFFALFLFGAEVTPAVIGGEASSWQRVAATALALTLTIGMQSAVTAQHPPAAATTMLITLGGLEPSWSSVLAVASGVTLVAALGALSQLQRHVDGRHG